MVQKAIHHLSNFDTIVEVAVHGEDHAMVIELGWRCAQIIYLSHFYGRDGYRRALLNSIRRHIRVLGQSSRVLGNHYPMTREIAASLRLCFDEQLDWSDDMPAELLAVRPLLDDVPADLARRLGGIVDSDDEGDPLDMWREQARRAAETRRLAAETRRRDSEADYNVLLSRVAERMLDQTAAVTLAKNR